MKLTTNYSLRKPDLKDKVNINDLNSNVDKIDEELKKVNDSLTNSVSNLSSQLDNKAKQVDLKTLENRMDSFTSLPTEGVSSAGDAELVDARNGADGISYNNIGTAIREQMNKKQDAIYNYSNIDLTIEDGIYNNITTMVYTTKPEWKHTRLTIEKGINYKISCRGINGEYSSIVGIDSKGGRYVILIGNNTYVKDYLLKSEDIQKYVSLVIITSDTNSSPIIVKKSKKIDLSNYIDNKNQELSNYIDGKIQELSNYIHDKMSISEKTMLCKVKENSCMIRFKYNDIKDCIILFTDYVNNCFKISHIYLIDNITDEIVWDFSGRTDETRFIFINSEWISPYKNLNALNNPLTNVTDQWTGGSHSIGSVKTNKIKSVKVYCDDVEIEQDVEIRCNNIKVVCTTQVSASNTTATTFENNRYVLNEVQEWTITPNNFDVNISFEFLEDCSLGINYGLQTENSGFTKLRHYGDSANLGLVNMKKYAYGCNKTSGIVNGWCLKDDNGNTLEVLLDTTYKCGNRCLLKENTPTIITASYGKTYSYIVSESNFKTGDKIEHRGRYKFYHTN